MIMKNICAFMFKCNWIFIDKKESINISVNRSKYQLHDNSVFTFQFLIFRIIFKCEVQFLFGICK